MPNVVKPLIIQGDRSILLDVHADEAKEARFALIPFAELEKSPEHLHTYRLTNLSLWNAASAGLSADDVMQTLSSFSRFPVPEAVAVWTAETISRYGKVKMRPSDSQNFLRLTVDSDMVFKEFAASKNLKKYLVVEDASKRSFLLKLLDRGTVKQVLLKQGWPVKDEVPLRDGEPLDICLRDKTLSGNRFTVRDYQQVASETFVGDRKAGTGFGTIVLPCGAGKTIVGILIMSLLKTNTLILAPNVAALYQWKRELLDKTNLTDDDIGLYTSEAKIIKPVTIATYQILTWRKSVEEDFKHFSLFSERSWGLIVYDEVHLLPAPVFRITAELQVIRRLGLTATLIREDGCESDVFSLVGPKRFDVPWKELEEKGWIAHAYCTEIRINLNAEKEIDYAVAGNRQKHRIASENSNKITVVKKLLEKHNDEPVLIIGQYISQLEQLAKEIEAPLLTGKTPNFEREVLYNNFRNGSIRILIVSKVANFAIDLPDASVAIQISGTFGSRQEEAQRLGRILRPKERDSHFYTIVTCHSVEEEFAEKRQKFLAEQGYEYSIITNMET
ncbi:MAG: DNA helicase [Treponema sp.]|nr:MAG: DNA helicase [Treponema sp.]